MNNLLTQDLDKIQNIGMPTFILRSGGRTSPDLGRLISIILPYVFSIAGIGLLVFLVISGLQMMMSRGDPKAMQMAQSRITAALIGFVIIFLAYSTVKLIGNIFGLAVFETIFK